MAKRPEKHYFRRVNELEPDRLQPPGQNQHNKEIEIKKRIKSVCVCGPSEKM